LIGDSNLGTFAHLSNLPLMKMDAEGHLVGQLADIYNVSEITHAEPFTLERVLKLNLVL